jgi:glutamate decarboxylase
MDGAPNVTDIMIGSVHTWMEPEADKLIMENISKNLCDQVRKAGFLGAE